ncbi:MAG: C-GCAxxG-C-C family (seleno)protein [Bacilli bacterium]
MKIDIDKIANDAADLYDTGGLFCSEAVLKAFNDNMNMGLNDMALQMASGFPIGVGKSKCMCGAISGGSMVLSAYFGRVEGKGPKDEKVLKCLELNNELISKFKERNKVACCSVLTKGMDFGIGEHKKQCVRFTKEVARDVAEILTRELQND